MAVTRDILPHREILTIELVGAAKNVRSSNGGSTKGARGAVFRWHGGSLGSVGLDHAATDFEMPWLPLVAPHFPGVRLRKGEVRQGAYNGLKGEVVPAHTAKSGVVTMSFDPIPGFTVETVRHEFGPAPIQVGVDAIASARPLGPSKPYVTLSSVVSNSDSNIPVTDVYMRYASPRDLATRLASHVDKSEAIFGVGANDMIVGVSLLKSEM